MIIPNQIISVDWGTTRFRAWLVNTNSGKLEKSTQNDSGIARIYEQFLAQEGLDQQSFFTKVLLELIAPLDLMESSIPIVASGMISSSIGLKELLYADFPIKQDGSNLNYELIKLSSERNLFVISGAKDQLGFMRGEETQAIGLSHCFSENQKCTLILCGTHSKHLYYENGVFINMKNFMTGELFETLSNHSLLKYSVEKTKIKNHHNQAFKEGVKHGAKEKLTANLLAIRYNDLIHRVDKTDNYFYLSGLLIGNELAYLNQPDSPIYVAGDEELKALYSTALEYFTTEDKIQTISSEDYKRSCLVGHLKLMKRQ